MRRDPRISWGRGVRAGLLLGLSVSLISVSLIALTWASCDIGINSSANAYSLTLLVPALWAFVAVTWMVIHVAVSRFGALANLAAGTVCAVSFVWFFVVWLGIMDSYPDPVCPGNVPPWWPRFIPT